MLVRSICIFIYSILTSAHSLLECTWSSLNKKNSSISLYIFVFAHNLHVIDRHFRGPSVATTHKGSILPYIYLSHPPYVPTLGFYLECIGSGTSHSSPISRTLRTHALAPSPAEVKDTNCNKYQPRPDLNPRVLPRLYWGDGENPLNHGAPL